MKTQYLVVRVLLAVCMAASILNISAQSVSRRLFFDFDTDVLPGGATLHGSAYIGPDGFEEDDSVLHLTDAVDFSFGHLRVPNIGEGMTVTVMEIRWRSLVGMGFGADGYSVNWARDLPRTPVAGNPAGEEGGGSGLTVTVDTFDNSSQSATEVVGLEIRWKTNIVAELAVPLDELRGDGFVDASLTVTADGLVTYEYGEHTLTAQLEDWQGIARGDIILSARTGGFADQHWIDDLEIHPQGVNPGNYAGLFLDGENWQHTNSGAINLKVTPAGAYSGFIVFRGARLPVSGRFDLFTLTSETQVTPPGGPALSVSLGFDNNSVIEGVIGNEIWTAPIQAVIQVWDKKRNPATNHAGQYVLVVNRETGGPGGFGYGTVTVDLAGGVKFAGVLGDGTKVVHKTVLGAGGEWPVYISAYAGRGSFQGWIQVGNSEVTNEELAWFKEPGVPGLLYPDGFTVYPETFISPYTPPAAGQRILPFFVGEAVFTISEDGFATQFGLTIDNKFINLGAEGLTVKFVPKSGLFSGTITDSDSGARVKFGGVVFAPESVAVGHFLGSTESGSVELRGLGLE